MSYTNPVSRTCFELVKKHITELHTKYPDLRLQVWSGSQRLNAAQAKESSQIVHRLNPQCIVLDNNHEMHATVIKGWMWTPTGQFFSAGELFKRYAAAGTAHQPFLLNVGIDPSGHIPDHQVAVLMDLKNLIAQKAAPTAAAAATPDGKPDAGERLKKLKSVHAQGLINQEDYDRKVKEIMDSL